jgi:SAM-dependent methyltransferase
MQFGPASTDTDDVPGRAISRERMPVTSAAACRSCGQPLAGPTLDLGMQPPCNRFSKGRAGGEQFALAVTMCPGCRLIQLSAYPPLDAIVPRVPWIRYTEQEGHLDAVARQVTVGPVRVLGIGPFDRPLLERIAGHGGSVAQLDLFAEAGVAAAAGFPYLETLQAHLRPALLEHIAKRHGRADLVVLRYLLEHSRDPLASLEALKSLIAPGGSLLIEIPDSAGFLARCDYSFIWEEHVCYFTENSIARLAWQAGYGVDAIHRYAGPLEDALVAILRPDAARVAAPERDPAELFSSYCAAFPDIASACRTKLQAHVDAGSRIALFGVGHQAIMFLNAMRLQPLIAMMVDDEPNKQGYVTAGSTVPVVTSAAMLDDPSIDVCLLAVSPRTAPKIKERLRPFADRGGRFYSIFAGVPDALLQHR